MLPSRTIWSTFYRDHAFQALGPEWRVETVSNPAQFKPRKGDLLLLLGGSDIAPSVYGQGFIGRDGQMRPRVAHAFLPPRDELEVQCSITAIEEGIGIIGCCRGGQMLCIMAGGSLVQDVTNHVGTHPLILKDGTMLSCNSIHHQMMRIKDTEHDLIGWSPFLSTHYYASPDFVKELEFPKGEPEIVYFPTIKGMAFQYHPESDIRSNYGKLALHLVKHHLLEGKS